MELVQVQVEVSADMQEAKELQRRAAVVARVCVVAGVRVVTAELQELRNDG
jgi:hypothetical protein